MVDSGGWEGLGSRDVVGSAAAAWGAKAGWGSGLEGRDERKRCSRLSRLFAGKGLVRPWLGWWAGGLCAAAARTPVAGAVLVG